MNKYFDSNGYPGTIQSDNSYDGGDTAAIMGTIWALNPYTITSVYPYNQISRVPLRHPDTTKWYGQPDRFSRDQLIACICGFINNGWDAYGQLYYIAHRKRWFLTAWNTKGNGLMDMPDKFPDICGPEVWALWMRYKHPAWAPAVLWFLDLQTLVGAVQWRWFTPATNRVTRNHMLVSLTSMKYLPSFISRIAYKINNWHDLISRWTAHCAAVGECPTGEMFQTEYEALK